MDSKLLIRALVLVTVFIVTIFGLVLVINGYGTRKNPAPTVDVEESEESNATSDGMIVGSDLHAWMYDETFYDEDGLIAKYAEASTQEPSLILTASSVEKDLRIRFLDDGGKSIKGRGFAVTITGEGEFRDVDRDGMIYIPELSPGEYEITIADAVGYLAPTKPLKCTVKAKLEYKAIEDISYLIKTEADIDVAKDDTAVNDAMEETTGNSAIRTVPEASFGIDVSKYNGDIDWVSVKAEGVKFAIIRCGYRGSSSGSIVVDPYFEANIMKATEAGIPVGVYFFTQAVNTTEAVEEASAVLTLTKDYKLDYPVFIDTEGAGGNGRADALPVADRTAVCQAFCETIRSGGHRAGIYASKNWFNKRLDITKLSADNVTWLAEYADTPSYGGTYQMWQYSSAGRINGIEGRVDMNLSYLSSGIFEQENEEAR